MHRSLVDIGVGLQVALLPRTLTMQVVLVDPSSRATGCFTGWLSFPSLNVGDGNNLVTGGA
jgi:hypothetical protein